MPLKITFEPNGRWTGGARIPSSLRDTSNLSEWIANFLKKFKKLGKTYRSYIGNDGKLIGQEKANLVIGLDDLISGLLVLRMYVTKDNPSHFNALKNKYRFKYKIRMDNTTWSGRGIINNRYKTDVSTFIDWYNTVLIKKLKLVFVKYQEAMADKVLTDEESIILIKFIEHVIFDVLVMERMLISNNVTT